MRGIDRLLEIMGRLREPEGGCPWDLEQDFDSIAPYTIEEAYEVAEAIAQRDFDALRDELGDLLLQVVFHAQLAREERRFDFGEVVEALCDKLVRRHPHVFGEARVESAAAQTRAWEEHKAAERAARGPAVESALDGLALGLPALLRAAKLQRRAARAGFAPPNAPAALARLEAEAAALRAAVGGKGVAARLGALLFACADLARALDVDAEDALRAANRAFEGRVRALETSLARAGRRPAEATPEELLSLRGP